jgi:hypothetical protein
MHALYYIYKEMYALPAASSRTSPLQQMRLVTLYLCEALLLCACLMLPLVGRSG